MNQTRMFLFVAWLMLAFMIWQAWQQDHALQPAAGPAPSALTTTNTASGPNDSIPGPMPVASTPGVPASIPPPAGTPVGNEAVAIAGPPVVLSNDVLRLEIDPRGASVVAADLVRYSQSEKRNSPPIKLLDTNLATLFVAESGLSSVSGHAPSHLSVFQMEGGAGDKVLATGKDSVAQSFVWTDPTGIQVRKTYVLLRGSYVVTLREDIRNGSSATWTGNDYRQLRRVPPIIKKTGGLSITNPDSYSFVGAAWYSPEDKYETQALTKFDPPLNKTVTGGWMAMVQHYFLAAWIPDPKEPTKLSVATDTSSGVPIYRIISQGPAMEIPAGGNRSINARLYVGPELQEVLPAVAPGLGLTMNYGWFTTVAGPLYWLLSMFHSFLGNWGWSIVALVLLIKLAMFKLSEAQYKSFAKLRAVQPRLEALKERYGDDKQQYQAAMMELYKKEKINPAGGCLPMLVQIPIFFALYRVLLYSVELRHAPWIGWIHSLSDPDPYFILPALNMIITFFTQRLTPSPGMDPMQKKMMQFMPLAMGVLFAFLPSGVVVYYVFNGALGLLQQWWLMRQHGGPGTAAVARK